MKYVGAEKKLRNDSNIQDNWDLHNNHQGSVENYTKCNNMY